MATGPHRIVPGYQASSADWAHLHMKYPQNLWDAESMSQSKKYKKSLESETALNKLSYDQSHE